MPSKRKNRHDYACKADNEAVTLEFLQARANRHAGKGYGKARWIEFCEVMLRAGFSVTLYEARQTFSKYVTISDGRDKFKVRFSNHRPIKSRELQGDCDFFVGVTHTGIRTTSDAIRAVEVAFGIDLPLDAVME